MTWSLAYGLLGLAPLPWLVVLILSWVFALVILGLTVRQALQLNVAHGLIFFGLLMAWGAGGP